ncbi:hypothetical protein D3C85_1570780 [compost metagenome]
MFLTYRGKTAAVPAGVSVVVVGFELGPVPKSSVPGVALGLPFTLLVRSTSTVTILANVSRVVSVFVLSPVEVPITTTE